MIGNTPVVTDPVRRGRTGVESYFFKLVSPTGDRALWVRLTFLQQPGLPLREELWAVAFRRGGPPVVAKRSRPAVQGGVTQEPFRVTAMGAWYNGRTSEGSVAAGRDTVTWDITVTPRIEPLTPYPHPAMYALAAVPTKLLTPIPDATAAGFFTVNGERVDVAGWRAMQGHNWGRRHTARYAWAHVGGFQEDTDAVFEGFSASPSVAGRTMPWLTMAFLHVDGAWLRFDGLGAAARATATVSAHRWAFSVRGRSHSLRGTLTATAVEVAGLHYPNPTGPLTCCLNSKLAHAALELVPDHGPVRRFTSHGAALEVATPAFDHGVAMRA